MDDTERISMLSNMLKESQDAIISGKNREKILPVDEHFRIWDNMWKLILKEKRGAAQ